MNYLRVKTESNEKANNKPRKSCNDLDKFKEALENIQQQAARAERSASPRVGQKAKSKVPSPQIVSQTDRILHQYDHAPESVKEYHINVGKMFTHSKFGAKCAMDAERHHVIE